MNIIQPNLDIITSQLKSITDIFKQSEEPKKGFLGRKPAKKDEGLETFINSLLAHIDTLNSSKNFAEFETKVNNEFANTKVGKYKPALTQAYDAIVQGFRAFFRLFHMAYRGMASIVTKSKMSTDEYHNPVSQKLFSRNNFLMFSAAPLNIKKEMTEFQNKFVEKMQKANQAILATMPSANEENVNPSNEAII